MKQTSFISSTSRAAESGGGLSLRQTFDVLDYQRQAQRDRHIRRVGAGGGLIELRGDDRARSVGRGDPSADAC